MTKRIVVLGLGRIGGAIAQILNRHDGYDVTGADINPSAVAHFSEQFKTELLPNTSPETRDYGALLAGQDAVISALTFNDNPYVAQAALDHGCSYFDLTEDVRCTQAIKEIALAAAPGQVFMPQCGLAPGFIGILGYSFRHRFDRLDTLKLRVGALPEYPSNQMMYNLTWSTEGLINEYANPCESIKNHVPTLTEPLEGREVFSISGVEYEAFNTSGGLANLCYSLDGELRELTYKTIRYPGHCKLMKFLFHDLRLGEEGKRRDMLMEIFESSVATTMQDLVLISVVATGYVDDRLKQCSRTFLLRHTAEQSAIQISTASAAVTTVDLILNGRESRQGFVEQETLNIDEFLANDFAKAYRDAELSI
ncbi:saccharopine dehydrogenase family protein [Moritella sp. F3]|uniref:saccharopine dehydrogenase family protein n=1 Tax=Moritella sp. F3 TaxID=2718882 RepID=UPI0018E14F4B|nr:saccharopine dehydrogenase C-terminal domain-containing protein [Moritella sp. F3]GIC78492.1 dehydrogenase [Moritella sp. F1]GIC81327.1 dehydrogenase [Moritella sp. F3]